MADKNVDYAHVDECPHVDEDVDNQCENGGDLVNST